MFKNYFILILLLLVSGLPVNGQQDTLKLVPGISVGYAGARIFGQTNPYPNGATEVHFSNHVVNPNLSLKLIYGKNNLDLGFSIGKRFTMGHWFHGTIKQGLTALLLNYQRRLFGSKTISFYGSYVCLNRFLNAYETVDNSRISGEFHIVIFLLSNFWVMR